MITKELQDRFVENMEMFENWADKFNYLISEGEYLPSECPEQLFPFRIEGCQSKTCFTAYIDKRVIRVEGWSNSAVMRGIIRVMINIFDNTSSADDIYFHIKSGLIDNITPMRRAALEEMIRRIIVLYK